MDLPEYEYIHIHIHIYMYVYIYIYIYGEYGYLIGTGMVHRTAEPIADKTHVSTARR
jgi:hypothetical protein